MFKFEVGVLGTDDDGDEDCDDVPAVCDDKLTCW